MSVSYVSRVCSSCASTKFEYIADRKVWRCIYCGNEIERREEKDSLYTIKNVVRQTLVDTAFLRFPEAKRNLVECEKMDLRYVGTFVAKICFYIYSSWYDACLSAEEKNNYVQLAKRAYSDLMEGGDAISEEEIALYEEMESAEAFGLLILIYNALGLSSRVEKCMQLWSPEQIFSMSLNANLLAEMMRQQQFEVADKIVQNSDNLDKQTALRFLLEQYPDGEQKAKNCCHLLAEDAFSFDDRTVLESYLESSADSLATKYQITCAALATAAAPSVRCVMSNVVTHLTSQDEVKTLLDIVFSKKLSDNETYTIIEYALEQCSQEVALYIMTLFKDTKQFVVLNQQHFILLLENAAIQYEYKQKIIDTALAFNVTEKTKEQFVTHYLNNVADEFEKRDAFIDYLFSLVSGISTVSAEKYILTVTLDGENKPKVVQKIFALDINKSFFRETLDKYVASNPDTPAVAEQIVRILSENGLRLSENTMAQMLVQNNVSEEVKLTLLRQIKSSGTRYLGLLDKYLVRIPAGSYSGRIMQELIDCTDSVSADAFIKYLLQIRDEQTSKSVTAKKLADKCLISVLTHEVETAHAGASIRCTVLQAYVLNSPDSPETTCAVLQSLRADDYKVNGEIFVAGSRKKFKKYLGANASQLSASAKAAAQALRLM